MDVVAWDLKYLEIYIMYINTLETDVSNYWVISLYRNIIIQNHLNVKNKVKQEQATKSKVEYYH